MRKQFTKRHIAVLTFKNSITDKSGAIVYYDPAKLIAQGFSGNRGNYDFYYRFKTRQELDKYIEVYFKNINGRIKAKEERKEKEAENKVKFFASIKVGDIFSECCGATMTYYNYHQVTRIGKSLIYTREIGKKITSGKGGFQYYVRPIQNGFEGKEKRRSARDGYITLENHHIGRLWDGEDDYENHLD